MTAQLLATQPNDILGADAGWYLYACVAVAVVIIILGWVVADREAKDKTVYAYAPFRAEIEGRQEDAATLRAVSDAQHPLRTILLSGGVAAGAVFALPWVLTVLASG
jgi:hypothetical protein